jgi:hypothetical protein
MIPPARTSNVRAPSSAVATASDLSANMPRTPSFKAVRDAEVEHLRRTDAIQNLEGFFSATINGLRSLLLAMEWKRTGGIDSASAEPDLRERRILSYNSPTQAQTRPSLTYFGKPSFEIWGAV